jgi:hypothetical protein
MNASIKLLLSLLVTISLILGGGIAMAGTKTFPAGSYIFPVDPCWQPNNDPNVITQPSYCDSDKDDQGIFHVYGMVYDLLKLGVPVYWIIQPNKSTPHDIDMSIIKGGSNPAVTIYHSTALSSSGSIAQIDYSGGPFVIDINDITPDIQTQAEQIIGIAAGGNIYTSSKIHQANYDFSAEVDKILSGTPPKVAVLGEGATQVLLDYLKASGLGNRVFGIFDTLSSTDIINGGLSDYQLIWAPHWILADEVTDPTDQVAVVSKIRQFIESGNSGFFECASIESLEGSYNVPDPGKSVNGVSGTGFLVDKNKPSPRIEGNGGTQDVNKIVWEDNSYFLTQCSGWQYMPTGGHIHNLRANQQPTPDYEYNTTVSRFIHDVDDAGITGYSPLGFDYYVGGRINGAPTQGYVSYLAGHKYIQCSEKNYTPVPSERDIELTFDRDISTSSSPLVTIEAVYSGCTEGSNCPTVTYDLTNPVEAIDEDGTVYVQTESTLYDPASFTLGPIIIGNITSTALDITKINVTFPTDNLSPAPPAPAKLLTVNDITDISAPLTICSPISVSKASCSPSSFTLGAIITDCTIQWTDTKKKKGGGKVKSNTCGIRYVLNTLFGLQFNIIPNEYSKAQPVVKDNIVYKATFEYPGYKGHLYAIDAVSDPAVVLWDAGANSTMPSAGLSNPSNPAKNNFSRYIFTNVPSTTTMIDFETSNLSTLKPLLYPGSYGSISDNAVKALINTVRGRKDASEINPNGTGNISKRLGGIEHSTPAVVGRSGNIRDSNNQIINRDKIVYTGNHDGMLHAFYAGSWNTTSESYDSGTGREIWAYIPSSLLSALQNQTYTDCNPGETISSCDPATDPMGCKCPTFPVAVSVDSSPSVGDFFIDIDGDGNKEFRTILVATAVVKIPGDSVQNVNQGIVFALDVTDPYNPSILWERTYPGTIIPTGITRNYYPSTSFPSSYINNEAVSFDINMGHAKGTAIGRVQVGVDLNTYVFLTSKWVNPVNTGSKDVWGLSAFALDFLTGDIRWSTKILYTGDAEGVNETPAIPVLMDIDHNGTDDYVIFGDMQGRLWALRTNDGLNITYDNPVFTVSDGGGNPVGAAEPIGASVAVYREAVVFGTGGRDSLPNEDTYHYHIYAIGITPSGGAPVWQQPITLGAGEKVWSPPLIDSNGMIFIGTASGYSDVGRPDLVKNASSGRLLKINLSTGAIENQLTLSGAVVGGIDIENRHAYLLTFGGEVIQIGNEDFSSSAASVNPFRVLWWRKL